MCGIAGVFNYREFEPVGPDILGTMAGAIAHRGPDDEGAFLDPRGGLGLAFRRLSIVDLAGGAQPMASDDDRYRIVFNGEIYNHLEIRKELEARGRRFRTRSDTEAIVLAYAEWGPDCVRRLQGMFAFAIWDRTDRRLFLARDRIGIKPLYHATVGGTFVFASEIKSLLEHPRLTAGLDRSQLAQYLTFLCIPSPATLFEGIRKLPAACTLTVEPGAGPGDPVRYWTPVTGDTMPLPEEELVEQVRELLVDAVHARLMSDVPFGAFLSGGIDSSSIVSIMARRMDRPVETFTVGYKDDPGFNEFLHARNTARHFGTNHHEVLIDHHDFKAFLPRLVHHQDEPIADPVCVPLYFVAELARRSGVIVTLVGEGSDELFFGYEIYNRIHRMVNRVWNPVSRLPRPLRALATATAAPFVDGQRRDFLRRLREGGEPFLGGAVTFYRNELRSLAPSALAGVDPEATVSRLYREFDERRPGGDFAARAAYLEFMLRLPELLLMRVDKMTMATSVEGRVPFLDHRLVELGFRIPMSLKVRGGVRKYILKEAVKGFVPKEILERPKVGFHVPVTRWFGEVLGPLAEEVLYDPAVRSLGLLDVKETASLLARQRTGRGNLGMRVWALVNFGLWYRHWFVEGGA